MLVSGLIHRQGLSLILISAAGRNSEVSCAECNEVRTLYAITEGRCTD